MTQPRQTQAKPFLYVEINTPAGVLPMRFEDAVNLRDDLNNVITSVQAQQAQASKPQPPELREVNEKLQPD